MKFRTLILFAAAALCGPALAADSYTLDAAHTRPLFEVRHLGLSIQHGRFNKATGSIVLDRATKKGSVDISIDAASIDMGSDKWEQHLKSEDFFSVTKYPSISFKSDRLGFEGDALAAVDGQLTMLGVTRPVRLAISHFRCAPDPFSKREACGADATATIKRSEFGMKYAIPAVADEVLLRIPVEAFKN